MPESLRLLEGVRVVAFTQFLLGPAAAQYLADMGADVIKIEEPTRGPHERRWAGAESFVNDVSTFFLLAHRNVRSLTLDLKREEAQTIARELCRDADVVLVNFRPGIMEKLGLGYGDLSRENPGLIYASASGYGSEGPHSHLPGQDLLLQAMTGLAAVTGSREGFPVAAGAAVVDQHSAALLAMGVLGALYHRSVSGEGQELEVTMVQGALDLQTEPFLYHLNGATVERPSVPLGSAFHEAPYGFYRVQDGYVALSLSPIQLVSEALGRPAELEPYLEPALAFTKREEIYSALSPLLSDFTKTELLERFRSRGIWCAPVHDYDDVVVDDAIARLEPIQEIEHPKAGTVRLLKHPVRYSSGEARPRQPPPAHGEHTEELLAELGYGEEEVRQLRESRIV